MSDYKKIKGSNNLKAVYENRDTNEGDIRLIKNKLYFAKKVIYGGYGYCESIWSPITKDNFMD